MPFPFDSKVAVRYLVRSCASRAAAPIHLNGGASGPQPPWPSRPWRTRGVPKEASIFPMAETQTTQNQTSGEGFAALFEQAASSSGAVEMGGEGQIVTGIVVAVHRDSV